MAKKPHPFRHANPKHIDCGDLYDAESGEYIRPATADEARRSIRAQYYEDSFRGVIGAEPWFVPALCYVRKPDGMALWEWWLAIALKIKWERWMARDIE